MKAIVFDTIGTPSDVLYLSDIKLPEVGDHDVLVKMSASPIIPGDFLFIQNMYPEPKKPVLPHQTGGNHGCGIVVKTGKNAIIKPGTFVFFTYYNTWAEFAVVPEGWLISLPADYSLMKASQFVNLITALDLVKGSGVKKDGWLVLTAGYSTVSLLAAQFARGLGIKVISIVRKLKSGDGPENLHADAVIDLSEEASLRGTLFELTVQNGINGVIDNVGGKTMEDLIQASAFGSTVVINGNMSPDKFELHNNHILFNGLSIRPYIYRYLLSPPKPEDQPFLDEVINLSTREGFEVKIAKVQKIEEYREAVSLTLTNAGEGKQVFLF
ncbi:zinc-binding dehydrogenase [Mucilaginibacter sp. 22184]|uniref:zinc-binding dehydrogenase n=1 Tax=Mucilaginibacter sp. 22184 TaxID=3453887 RepID=UPI003F84DE13